MPLKVNIGLSKKIGQPNYGSLGASCHVEFELDGSYDNGSSEHFQDAARRAYLACRQAVETEISANQPDGVGGQHASTVNRVANHGNQTSNGSSNNGSNRSGNNGNGQRNATSSQVRAIHAIANRNRADLPNLLNTQFGVSRPDDLSIGDASSLIDQLKGSTNGANGSNGMVSQ